MGVALDKETDELLEEDVIEEELELEDVEDVVDFEDVEDVEDFEDVEDVEDFEDVEEVEDFEDVEDVEDTENVEDVCVGQLTTPPKAYKLNWRGPPQNAVPVDDAPIEPLQTSVHA